MGIAVGAALIDGLVRIWDARGERKRQPEAAQQRLEPTRIY
jgi:hypothetical protein